MGLGVAVIKKSMEKKAFFMSLVPLAWYCLYVAVELRCFGISAQDVRLSAKDGTGWLSLYFAPQEHDNARIGCDGPLYRIRRCMAACWLGMAARSSSLPGKPQGKENASERRSTLVKLLNNLFTEVSVGLNCSSNVIFNRCCYWSH